jgi:hypothetical protein
MNTLPNTGRQCDVAVATDRHGDPVFCTDGPVVEVVPGDTWACERHVATVTAW